MTLEDFFTLTEMKNGLTTLARVEELINIMQQQKDYSINNISDTARQWTSVASTLAATEDDDCLNHFVKLNGLSCLKKWIHEALKFSKDNTDNTIEEFLNTLLGSLERFPVFKEDPAASEIQSIVEQLVGFKSLSIKEKARALAERWKDAMEIDASFQNTSSDEKSKDDNIGTVDNMKSIPSVVDNSNNRQLDKITELSTEKADEETLTNAISEDMDALPSTIVPNSFQENLSALSCPNTPGDVTDENNDASVYKDDSSEDIKMNVDTEEISPSNSGKRENFKVPSPSGLSVPSIIHKPERSVSCSFDAKEKKSPALDSIASLPRSVSIDCVVPKYLRNMDLKPDIQDLLCNGSKLKSKDDIEETLDKMEEAGRLSEVKLSSLKPSEKKSIQKSTLKADQNSDFELEYGEIDALEVARQVAIEVEREVVDYREPFCSSSPDCNSREDDDEPRNEERNHLDNVIISEKTEITPHKCEQNVEMSSKPITRESSNETDKNRCVFDLNEDICVEESGSVINSNPNNSVSISISTPIAVAASKVSPALPVSPLQFEGELGWKGSAATSAFRPTSSRRTSDVERSSSGQKRKANLIEFDLNVADSECDPIDPVPINPVPIPSREDSVEVSSQRPDKLKLDLNQLGDEETSQLPSSLYWSLPRLNVERTMSPASSSSSKQPQIRDFDLNDNPNFFDAMGSHKKPEITIMGSKISDKKDHINEAPKPFMGSGPSVGMPYGHFPIHASGYNGNMMHSMAFPMPHYAHGNIPYMVDSRGATVVPQILNNVGLNATAPAMPHFLMSLNGAGTSQSGLDLNSLENGNFKNFFMQGRNGLTEEQMRAASQPQGSMNRKETHSGREPYNFMASWQ